MLGSGLGSLAGEVGGECGAHTLGRIAGLSAERRDGPWPAEVVRRPAFRRGKLLVLSGRAPLRTNTAMPPGIVSARYRRPLAGGRAVGKLLLTNAAGSLRPEMAPGSVMMITDHINFSGTNPLFRRADRPGVSLA